MIKRVIGGQVRRPDPQGLSFHHVLLIATSGTFCWTLLPTAL